MSEKTTHRLGAFLQKIEITESGCWEWTGQLLYNGYGRFNYRSTKELAHRESFQHFIGPIPTDKIVCHTCDNRKCVRPSHLWAGTYQDNTQDGITKGRITPWNDEIRSKRKPKTSCVNGHPLTPDNIYHSPKSGRRCLQCRIPQMQAASRRYVAKRRLQEAA